ncbi:MAG: uridine kinase [Clostridia bacterium]|nr:uridine kinase [Clostridia bacterium]
MKKPLVIGIAGGSGSGKSTITKILFDHFAGKVTVMNHDDYYKAQHELSYVERCKVNYDAPEAFDTGLFIEHIKKLRDGQDVMCPVYDFKIHDRSDELRLKKSAEVIIIDGILILQDEKLRALMDIKLFVDTDADVRVLRRIRRDVNERRRTLDSVIDQYLQTVKPMHELYVEPSKKFADLIIPEGGKNIVAMEILKNRISSQIG